ncbi:MAG: DUF3096 domain-containing protein [Chloroflexota bacterium]
MEIFGVGGLLGSILAIIAGIIVIIWPHIIAYVVGIYLVIVGILGLIAIYV